MLRINLIEKIQFTFNFGGSKRTTSIKKKNIHNLALNTVLIKKNETILFQKKKIEKDIKAKKNHE